MKFIDQIHAIQFNAVQTQFVNQLKIICNFFLNKKLLLLIFRNFTCDSLALKNSNFCSNIKCQNNGICISLLEGFECICEDGFSGILCQNEISKTNLKTKAIECFDCQNNSICRKKILNGEIVNYCDCLPGFNGEYCNEKIDTCFLGKNYFTIFNFCF